MSTKTYTSDSAIGQALAEAQRLTLEIDRLKGELESQKAVLLKHAKRHGLAKLVQGALTASVRSRDSWTYSPAVQEAEDRLKGRKKREQQQGLATCQSTEYLRIDFSARVSLTKQP